MILKSCFKSIQILYIKSTKEDCLNFISSRIDPKRVNIKNEKK